MEKDNHALNSFIPSRITGVGLYSAVPGTIWLAMNVL